MGYTVMEHLKQPENMEHLEHAGNLEGFLDFCQYQRSMSINTLRGYQYDLTEYLRWLQERQLDPVTVKTKDVDVFFIWLRKETGNTIQTTNRKMYALRSFYRWLLRQEIINRSPLEHFRNVRTPKMLPKYLTPAEQEALLNASIPAPINAPINTSVNTSVNDGNGKQRGRQRSYWTGLRDHLLTILLLDTGLRISEACSVEPKNMNLDEGILTVVGKGSKQREVVLSERVIRTTREYISMVNGSKFNHAVGPQLPSRGLNMRKVSEDMGIICGSLMTAVRHGSDHSAIFGKLQTYIDERVSSQPMRYLFFNEQGKPLGTRHAFKIILNIGNKAGIMGLHPHTLRHTYATNLRRKGGDLLLIKEALGHSSVSTTEIYAHMGNQEYKENLRRLVN